MSSKIQARVQVPDISMQYRLFLELSSVSTHDKSFLCVDESECMLHSWPITFANFVVQGVQDGRRSESEGCTSETESESDSDSRTGEEMRVDVTARVMLWPSMVSWVPNGSVCTMIGREGHGNRSSPRSAHEGEKASDHNSVAQEAPAHLESKGNTSVHEFTLRVSAPEFTPGAYMSLQLDATKISQNDQAGGKVSKFSGCMPKWKQVAQEAAASGNEEAIHAGNGSTARAGDDMAKAVISTGSLQVCRLYLSGL